MAQPACPCFPEMEPKDKKPSVDGAAVSPTADDTDKSRGSGSAEEDAGVATGKTPKERPLERKEEQEKAPDEDGVSTELQREGDGPGEVKVDSQGESGRKEDAKAEPPEKDPVKDTNTAAFQEMTECKEEAQSEPKEAEDKKEATPVSEKQEADEKEAKAGPAEEVTVNDTDKPGSKEAGEEEAALPSEKQDTSEKEAMRGPAEGVAVDDKDEPGSKETTTAAGEESHKVQEPPEEAKEKAADAEAEAELKSQQTAVTRDQAEAEPEEAGKGCDAHEGVSNGS